MGKLAGAGQQHGLLPRALGRQQTSMPSGSGLLPGPALRALRARRDHRGSGMVGPFPLVGYVLVLAVALWSAAGRCLEV